MNRVRSASRALLLLPLAALGVLSGCSKSPTTPTPDIISDTFTGTLQVLGNDSKRFTVSYALAATDASVTVTGLTVQASGTAITPTIGVGFGSIAFDGSCARSTQYSATAANINQELVAQGIFTPGQYCVQIFDSGTLTEPTNYTMVVKHF